MYWAIPNAFPLTINSTQRSNIITLLNTATAAETALVNAISTAEAAAASATVQANLNTVVNGVIATATGNISTLTTDLGQLSSTNYLTLGNYNSYLADYNKALAQTVNSGTTLYTIANGLSITTQLTNFTAAVTALNTALVTPFSGATFPAAITTIQTTALQTALTNVASTENLLIAQIASVQAANAQSAATSSANGYTDTQIGSVNTAIGNANSAIGSLNTDFNNLSSATYLTAAEAQSLLSDLHQAQAQVINPYDGSQNTSAAYATPAMTANNAPTPVVISASNEQTGYSAWQAFNQNSGDFWLTPGTGTLPKNIMIDLGAANVVAINKYRWQAQGAGNIVTAWQLQGSNNTGALVGDAVGSSNWVNLDTRSSGAATGTNWTSYFTFLNSQPYRYYRICITGSGDGAGWNVGFTEIQLVAASSTPTLYSIAAGLGITSQLTAYTTAVTNLASGLTSWVNE